MVYLDNRKEHNALLGQINLNMGCRIKENMDAAKIVGLAFLGSGILILVAYGLYNILKSMGRVDPVIFIASLIILFGIVILIAATAMDRRSGEEKKIKKEDMEP